MAMRPSPEGMKKPRSRKVDTSIIVALIARIGTIATALLNSPAILELIRSRQNASPSSAEAQLHPNPSNPLPAASVAPLSGGEADCLKQQFADIDPARQMSIEAGADQEYRILSEDLSAKDSIGPIGIRLTQNGKMIAALSFIFLPDSHLYKITSLVDSACQAVAEYSNVERGGDHNALQDSDTLEIKLAEGTF